jgi:hypothetical protein
MRKLPAAIAGLAIAITLSTPAWADGVQSRHHRFGGQSDSSGADRARYDERHHDDDGSILF